MDLYSMWNRFSTVFINCILTPPSPSPSFSPILLEKEEKRRSVTMQAVLQSLTTTAARLPRWLLTLTTLWTLHCSADIKQTRLPLYSQKPVLLVWNAPTQDCTRHGVTLSLDQFHFVASPNEGFVRQNLTIFYKERLGLYPYYERGGRAVNGGLPQLASLTQHYEKMPADVQKYIREPGAKGLAVIDWEEWRPLWIRNWDSKDIYRNKSREMVDRKNPQWTQEQVAKVAQQEFELSARRFMLETLKLGKNLRPNQLWGFYLFPDCYNHDYRTDLKNYTGRCPHLEMTRNDQLNWLWMESTAFFPSIYMGSVLRSSKHGRLFVRNRVKEAMRLASVGDGLANPVFVYTRPTYMNEMTLLSEVSWSEKRLDGGEVCAECVSTLCFCACSFRLIWSPPSVRVLPLELQGSSSGGTLRTQAAV